MTTFLYLSLGVFFIALSAVLLAGLISVIVCWHHWIREKRRGKTE